MIVFLWDATGPAGSGGGVSDDQARAQAAAETWMRAHGPGSTAQMQKARTLISTRDLDACCQPVGPGRTVHRHADGRITWGTARLRAAAGPAVNGQAAGQVAAQLQDRYPGADIRVTPQPGGLHVQVRTPGGSTIQASIGNGPSAILAALGAYAPRPAQQAAP